jgi:hypothetical protein
MMKAEANHSVGANAMSMCQNRIWLETQKVRLPARKRIVARKVSAQTENKARGERKRLPDPAEAVSGGFVMPATQAPLIAFGREVPLEELPGVSALATELPRVAAIAQPFRGSSDGEATGMETLLPRESEPGSKVTRAGPCFPGGPPASGRGR